MAVSPSVFTRLSQLDDERLRLRLVELGPDVLGTFSLPWQPTPDGRGTYRPASKGAMFQSDLYGSVFVAKAIMDVWSSAAVAKATQVADSVIVIGSTVQTTLGLPTKDSTVVGNAAIGWFENGLIVARGGTGVAIYGPIYLHYMKLGGPGSWAGLPTSTVLRAPGQPGPQGQAQFGAGTLCRFDNCDIYWSRSTGAAEVHGLIRDRYNALGASANQIGFPTTDELPVRDGIGLFSLDAREIGRVNRFERGSIYWSAATGAWVVDEWMLPTYTTMHGPAGSLGFPTGPTSKSPGGARWYQNFQNGVLCRPIGGGDVTRITKLDLYIDQFEPYGGDGLFGGAVDMSVNVTAKGSDGQVWQQRFPENATSYQGSATLQKIVHTFPVRDGGMVLDLTFDAWDNDPRRLGTTVAQHTIDNFWEIENQDTERHGDFRVAYNVKGDLPYDPNKVRQQLFWQFPNPSVPELSKDQFAQTYRDVEQDEAWWQHPFNALFYETIYKGFGAAGLCFGLSLEAARAHHGQSISNEPINRYVADPIRMNEAIVHHGYQLGGDQIDYFVEEFVLGHTHDPVRAFNESRAAYARGDYPILSVSNDTYYSKGHAVMPYRWDTSDPNRWVMFICNPNRPLPPGSGTGSDASPGNIIEILNPRSGNPSFRYVHSLDKQGNPADTWSGDTNSGGRMLAIPLHVLSCAPRTPFWEVLIAAIGATVILCADGGTTDGVSIDKRGGDALPPGQLPPGITPIPFHDVPGRALQMLRVDRRAFADPGVQGIAHRIRSSGRYSWGMKGPGVSAVVRATGASGIDTLSLSGRDAGKPAALTVTAGAAGSVRALTLDLAGHGLAGPGRRFRIDRVSLAPGRTFSTSVESGGEELVLRGGREPMTVRVAAQRVGGLMVPRDIRVDPAQAVRLRPTDWRPEKLGAAQLKVDVLDLGGAVQSSRLL